MHGPDKKPSRGVCQICGRPVVAYRYEAHGGCFHPGPVMTSGHEFDHKGKLASVRCPEHAHGIRANRRELERPPTQEELDLASKIRGSTVEAPPVKPPRDPNLMVLPRIKGFFPTLTAADICSVQSMKDPLTIDFLTYKYEVRGPKSKE